MEKFFRAARQRADHDGSPSPSSGLSENVFGGQERPRERDRGEVSLVGDTERREHRQPLPFLLQYKPPKLYVHGEEEKGQKDAAQGEEETSKARPTKESKKPKRTQGETKKGVKAGKENEMLKDPEDGGEDQDEDEEGERNNEGEKGDGPDERAMSSLLHIDRNTVAPHPFLLSHGAADHSTSVFGRLPPPEDLVTFNVLGISPRSIQLIQDFAVVGTADGNVVQYKLCSQQEAALDRRRWVYLHGTATRQMYVTMGLIGPEETQEDFEQVRDHILMSAISPTRDGSTDLKVKTPYLHPC